MQKALFRNLVILSILFISACGEKLDTANLDLSAWQQDKYGCNGLRLEQVEELTRIRENFKGVNNKGIIAALGRPDEIELVSQEQKIFIYFLEPSPEKCEDAAANEFPLRFFLRMNSLNITNEAVIDRISP